MKTIIIFILLQFGLYTYEDKLYSCPLMTVNCLGDVNPNNIFLLQDISKQCYEIQFENENIRKKIYFIGAAIISMLLLMHSHAYMEYLRRKINQEKNYLSKLNIVRNEICRKSEHFIEENKKKIGELELKLRDESNINTSLRMELQRQKQLMLCLNRQIEVEIDEQKQAEADLMNSTIYINFKGDYNAKRNSADWQALQEAVDKTYKNFTNNLRKLYDLSDFELRVCLLIKINVQPLNIAKLTNHTKESITATRRRLYEKVFHEKGTPKLWDEFIHAL